MRSTWDSIDVKWLFVLRHAKSSWADDDLDDHDRPLNQRGERAAVLMGATLAQQEVALDRILASTARRVRQTLERVQSQLATAVPVSYEKDLYLASAETWLERLRSIEDVNVLMVVGHNPGLEDLVRELAPTGHKKALLRMREGLPTAALAKIELPVAAWGELTCGVGRLISLLRPKDLV